MSGVFSVGLPSLNRGGSLLFFPLEFLIHKANRAKRIRGYIVHIAPARSAAFWAILKDESGTPYFAYGRNFLSPDFPRIGRNVEFVVLPSIAGHPLQRATEVSILPSKPPRRKLDEIIIVRLSGGVTRIVVRDKTGDKVLGELLIR